MSLLKTIYFYLLVLENFNNLEINLKIYDLNLSIYI